MCPDPSGTLRELSCLPLAQGTFIPLSQAPSQNGHGERGHRAFFSLQRSHRGHGRANLGKWHFPRLHKNRSQTHALSLSLRVANHFLPSFLSWLARANEREGASQGVCPTYRVTHPLPPQPSCTWDQPTHLDMSSDSAKLDIRKPGACPSSAAHAACGAA